MLNEVEMEWMPPFPDGIAECQSCGCSEPQKREGGIHGEGYHHRVDLAKNVFQVHGAAADGSVLFRKKLPRSQDARFAASRD